MGHHLTPGTPLGVICAPLLLDTASNETTYHAATAVEIKLSTSPRITVISQTSTEAANCHST